MATKKPKPDPDGPSFEDALKRLEQIVHLLEEGEIGLNESLERYEEGVRLLRRSYDLLELAEQRIELLSGVDAQGNPVSQPFEQGAADSLEKKSRQRSRRRSASSSQPTQKKGKSPAPETDIDMQGGLF